MKKNMQSIYRCNPYYNKTAFSDLKSGWKVVGIGECLQYPAVMFHRVW